MWISKKKYESEITRIKNDELWKSFDREAEIRQERDIEKLKKQVKKLKKWVKNGY